MPGATMPGQTHGTMPPSMGTAMGTAHGQSTTAMGTHFAGTQYAHGHAHETKPTSSHHHATTAEKIDELESMPLKMQTQHDRGLVNYFVRNQYNWEKVAFIRKVYFIVILCLFTSYLISIPFMRDQSGTVKWLYQEHKWILWFAGIFLTLQLVFYLTVLGFLMTGQHMLLIVYIKMLTAFPVNYVWTLVYVVSFTLIVDTALATFDFAFFAHTFLYTMFQVMGLYLYTYAVRVPDFKMLYCYLVPIFVAILIWSVLLLFGDQSTRDHWGAHKGSILLSIALAWIAAYDTQLIFGAKVERGRKYPYQIRMYTMAAFEMYFDLFINFYLGALNLFPVADTDEP